jgi:hypothetical protein
MTLLGFLADHSFGPEIVHPLRLPLRQLWTDHIQMFPSQLPKFGRRLP